MSQPEIVQAKFDFRPLGDGSVEFQLSAADGSHALKLALSPKEVGLVVSHLLRTANTSFSFQDEPRVVNREATIDPIPLSGWTIGRSKTAVKV